MPADYSGTWDIVTNVNFEGYMVAIGIDFATRKIAGMLKPQKVIEQDGDSFIIKTLTTFRNYTFSFRTGEELDEVTKGLDNRKCKVTRRSPCTPRHRTVVNWDNNKLVCVQRGEKKNRGWTHWLEGNELHLEMHCEDQVCKQVYKKSA
ncbi:retinoid-binding protein 7-like isoform X2 [Paramormyrops kingsleyae]|uniref:retinoid-binding protein 7-like isoform X2 n=1 Tax=Paramormyrops kingsleyae TaxID=1676925 RepID=UPI000CD5FD13|nr:retinoid-binding protein 7-like isoform X2 [Paramormyrops kingsleyae]